MMMVDAMPEERRIVLPGQVPDGTPILSVLLKRSYRLQHGGQASRLPEVRPLVTADIHYGGPLRGPVQFESDLVPWKLATDVVVHGSAHAPKGEKAPELVVSVAVDGHRKDLIVTGDRVAYHRPGKD